MRSAHFVVRWEVSNNTSQNDALTEGIDEEEQFAELCPDDGMFRSFISIVCGMVSGVAFYTQDSPWFS